MTGFAMWIALGAAGAGLAAALLLKLLPTVRLQLAGLALIAGAVPLGAVMLGGLVMLHMNADVHVLEVAASAASTAVFAALLLGWRIARRVRALESAANTLAAGD